MKKVLMLLFAVVTMLFLTACNTSEFQVDGKFTAYEVSVYSNAPQLTYVTVTIENKEIVAYNIDVRQGTATQDGENYSYGWKEMTKKELGDAYNMKLYGSDYELIDGAWVEQEGQPEYEWYEQANLIEQHLLDNGVDSLETVDDRISNVAGVSINEDGIIELAQEAVELAKLGKFQAVHCVADDLYMASMIMDSKGNISELELDVLQGDPNGETFTWKEMTKQELGELYGMKGMGSAYDFVDGNWVASDEKTSLEWYEQANLITDYIEANGWNQDLQALADRGATIDGTTLIDDLAGVTIRSQTLFDVLSILFEHPN